MGFNIPLKKVFVTGASGFVGSAVTQCLLARGVQVVALSRSNSSNFPNCKYVVFDLKGVDSMTADALHGCDTIIHCAARLPDRKSTSKNNQGEFAEAEER